MYKSIPDPLDKELEKRGHKFARYADDFTILVKSRRAGERVLGSISQYLSLRLKLIVNTAKSRVVKASESKFLGFTFNRGRIQWHPKTLQKFKQQVRRRVRMAQWRQWRTKIRNLMRLGVHVKAAVACGITSKGPWRSAKSPGINQALSLDFLTSEGLYSLRDGWIARHYPK
jgi:RNA-directed DNA polymerase